MQGLLVNRAEIRRRSYSNTGPEPGESVAVVATDVPCRVNWLTGKELGVEVDPSVARVVIFLVAGVDVGNSDLVVVGSDSYEVESVNGDAAARGHHMEVWAKVVR